MEKNQTEFDFDKWASEREYELFEKARFKEIGREDDYFFQVLSFMGMASQKMSLGYTIASTLPIPKEIRDEMRDIASRYHELQDEIRTLSSSFNRQKTNNG